MHSKKIEKFLIKKGYKRGRLSAFDSDSVVSNYYQVMYRAADLPFCLSNDKPPQICIKEWFHDYPNMKEKPFHGFEISICNETPQGWIDFKFYSLDEKEIVKRFDEIESALLETWRHLFSLKEQTSVHTVKR